MGRRAIYADVAVGHVGIEGEDEPMQVAVPCLIHREHGLIWQSGPVPMGPLGLQAAAAVLKETANVMRSSAGWTEVYREIDWSVLGKLGGANRKARRAHGV